MTKPNAPHPEKAVMVAVLLIGGATFLAGILLIAGVWGGGRAERASPYGIGLVLVAIGVAAVVLAYSRRRRRSHRPEWLETKAWHQGLVDKLHEGEKKPPV
jgi:hypothetical protein